MEGAWWVTFNLSIPLFHIASTAAKSVLEQTLKEPAAAEGPTAAVAADKSAAPKAPTLPEERPSHEEPAALGEPVRPGPRIKILPPRPSFEPGEDGDVEMEADEPAKVSMEDFFVFRLLTVF